MTLRKRVCSIPSEYRLWGKGVWPNRHIT